MYTGMVGLSKLCLMQADPSLESLSTLNQGILSGILCEFLYGRLGGYSQQFCNSTSASSDNLLSC